jgi:hypothetical protein
MNNFQAKICGISILVLSVYAACTAVLGHAVRVNFNSLVVFDMARHDAFILCFLKTAIAALSVFIALFLPGAMWAPLIPSSTRGGLAYFLSSLAGSVFLYALFTTIYKIITGAPLTRTVFIGIAVVLVISGYMLSIYKKPDAPLKFDKRKLLVFLAGIVIICMLTFIFRGKIFVEDLNGDGVEAFKLADSLKSHVLPYWDLEQGGAWGLPVVNPYLTNSMIHNSLLLLLGNSESSIRITYFLCLGVIYFIVVGLIRMRRHFEFKCRDSILVFLCLSVYTLIMFYYSGHNPYFSDISVNAAVDTYMMLFFLAGTYFLLSGNMPMFLIFSVMAGLTRYSGPLLTFLQLSGYMLFFRENRNAVIRITIIYAAIMLSIGIFLFIYGSVHGLLPYWMNTIKSEYISKYVSRNSLNDISIYLKQFIILCGGIPFFSLFFSKKGDRVSGYLTFITLIYALIVFGSGIKHIHYFAPVSFLPLIIFARLVFSASGRIWRFLPYFSVALSLILIYLLSPFKYSAHTEYREIGSQTCMLFGSEQEALRHSDILEGRYSDPAGSFYIEGSAWVYYSEITLVPSKMCHYYLADKKYLPKGGLIRIAENKNTVLYATDSSHASPINKKTETRKELSPIIFK